MKSMCSMKFNNQNIFIGKNVTIGDNVKIGDNVRLYDNVTIGDNCTICNDCVLGEPVADYYEQPNYVNPLTNIGSNSLLRSHSIVYAGSTLGEHFSSGHRVSIREFFWSGKNVRIGTNCDIQNNVHIENNSWLHSGIFVPAKTQVGKYVMIYPHVVFTDDPYPPSNQHIAPKVGDFAQVGAGSIILPGITLGKHVLVGAGTVVTKSVPDSFCVLGNPGELKKRVEDITLEDGSPAYPWPTRFSRGMPWEEDGFLTWQQRNHD